MAPGHIKIGSWDLDFLLRKMGTRREFYTFNVLEFMHFFVLCDGQSEKMAAYLKFRL